MIIAARLACAAVLSSEVNETVICVPPKENERVRLNLLSVASCAFWAFPGRRLVDIVVQRAVIWRVSIGGGNPFSMSACDASER